MSYQYLFLTVFIPFVAYSQISEVRWLYSSPPKLFKPFFQDKKFSKYLGKLTNESFVNKNNYVQVSPENKKELLKRLNILLGKMKELQFNSKRTNFYVYRSEKKKGIKGLYFKQANRVFCLPCLFKEGDRIVYGELTRKDVFRVKEGERPVLMDFKQAPKKIVQKKNN